METDDWISVADLFPEKNRDVLTIRENGKQVVDLIYTTTPVPTFWRTRPDNPVTDWMPLPKPPNKTRI